MLSCGTKCYHQGRNANVANVIILYSEANVIIWCYHVMLSSGMITPPFFIFPGNFTHSVQGCEIVSVQILCKLLEPSTIPNQRFRRGMQFVL